MEGNPWTFATYIEVQTDCTDIGMIFGLLGIDSWCHGLHGNDLLVVSGSHRAHHKEGSAALRVTSVLQFLVARHLEHIIDHCGQIIHADLVPTEVPELGGIRIECGMVSRVAIAPCITQPDIVVMIGQ